MQGGRLLVAGGVMDPQGVIHPHPVSDPLMAGRVVRPKGALANGTVCGYMGTLGRFDPDTLTTTITTPDSPAFDQTRLYRMEGVAPVEVPQPGVFVIATDGDLVLGEADFLRVLR